MKSIIATNWYFFLRSFQAQLFIATALSFQEFTCSTCGSGFIEEIAEADDSRDLGQGGSSDDPWAHDTETDGDQEVRNAMINQRNWMLIYITKRIETCMIDKISLIFNFQDVRSSFND